MPQLPRLVRIGMPTPAPSKQQSRRTLEQGTHCIVASSDANEKASLHGARDRRIGGLGEWSIQAQVREGGTQLALGRRVLDRPVEARQHVAQAAHAVLVQDLDGDEVGLLGDAEGARADGARHVRAVPGQVVVDTVLGEVGAELGPALELKMRRVDARVNDVGDGTGAGRIIEGVDAVIGGLALGDARQAPCCIGLGDEG